jgi:hypothetical protein
VTSSLAAAPRERLAAVVTHEDFHEQIQALPGRIAEAAATLVGFATAAEALGNSGETELFLRKAEIVNRYFDRLSGVYRESRAGRVPRAQAAAEKLLLLSSLERECGSIEPAPRSFNRCLAAVNNAGLAFDHTYTKYYPLLYRVFEACGDDVKTTIGAIVSAPHKKSEAESIRYFEALIAAKSRPAL